jgi:TRAP-type C4-dicarboxylate transport system permease small subunit
MIRSLTKNLRRILKYGILLSTLGLVLSVLIQIYGRFFLAASPPWTEEASRLFFIYTVAFAAAPAFSEGYFISLDLLPGWISDVWKERLSAFVQIFIITLCGMLAVYAFQFVQLGMAERSPGMGMRMGWAFFSVALLFGSVALLGLLDFLRRGISRN